MGDATVERIEAGDELSESADIVEANLESMRSLFPEAFSEEGIDFEVLRQLLGDEIADGDEKYGLSWHGKKLARRIALTPSMGTLRPCPEESVDWDETQNLMIEGDNLEVLKLLQKSYSGKVKLIYIDPPYNTGKEFVYPDNYRDSIANYLELTGQIDEEGKKLSTNTESSGRFHTDWLNMMYPRLKLARNLLREDGVIFISIDENEIENLIAICNEIFGEENQVAQIAVVVNPRGRHLDPHVAKTHDYLLAYARNGESDLVVSGLPKSGRMLDEYDLKDARGQYRELGLRNRNQSFNPKTRPNLYYPLYVDGSTGSVSADSSSQYGVEVWPDSDDGVKTCWTWSRDKVRVQAGELTARQLSGGRWRVFRKDYLVGEDGEVATTLAKTVWTEGEFNNDVGRALVKELFGAAVMSFPKPVPLMERVVRMGCPGEGIVMDFFAGSGSFAHGALAVSASDGIERRFVQVQLPEEIDSSNAEGDRAASFLESIGAPLKITELTKERLRRAGAKVKADHPEWDGDVGFRVFKLDTSNIRMWSPDRDEVEVSLLDYQEHLGEDRSEDDILYEMLLKLGLDLCVPIEECHIGGVAVSSVGGGVLVTCLAELVPVDAIEALGTGVASWLDELQPAGDTTVIFRDSSFENDVAKTNIAAILNQAGVTSVRSI